MLNPKGRPSAGASIREWVNILVDWPDQKIRELIDDPDAPRAKKIAAHRVLSDEGADFDRIMDRTEGRPKQVVEQSGEVAHVVRIFEGDH